MSKTQNKKPVKTAKDAKAQRIIQNQKDYAFAMSEAPMINQSSSWLHMVPIAFFAAIVIMVVTIHPYTRAMTQFYWTSDTDTSSLSDFFSYGKAMCILVASSIGLLMLLYRLTTQSLAVKKTYAYIPMGIYSIFVILSYIFSDYKDFALMGWNDRFEGTIPILCYMFMLFMIINSVNTEKNIKEVLWPIAVAVTILSLIGISQGTGHDFFRTVLGQQLLCLDFRNLDNLKVIKETIESGQEYLTFTFNNNEIYQTVYNINYVSFYLTLLVPLFTMLFLRACLPESKEKLSKKILLGVFIALMIYNLIGSASSGGFLGIGVALIVAIILFNKQILKWIKPLVIVLVIIAITAGATTDRWLPEITNAVKSVLNINSTTTTVEEEEEETSSSESVTAGSVLCTIDYMETVGNNVTFSLAGNPIRFEITASEDFISSVNAYDEDNNPLTLMGDDNGYAYYIIDDRYINYAVMYLGYDSTIGSYMQIRTCETSWIFIMQNNEAVMYIPATGKTTKLAKVEHVGFENNQNFGSGRGYIWSRSLPLLKDTLIIGTGADTYCAVFPQNDYAGKYNAYGATNILLIVDKPHNMYIHMGVGTGVISLIAMLCLYGIYIIQSIKLYRKRQLEHDFLSFAGAGAFLGSLAFMVTGLVDDSTVSVMPLFYTTLGLGISINLMIKRRDGEESSWRPWLKKAKANADAEI